MVLVRVCVGMFVAGFRVPVLVLVFFTNEQQRTGCHEGCGKKQDPLDGSAENHQGQDHSCQGSHAKQRAGPGCAHAAHCQDEQHDACPITQAAQNHCPQDDPRPRHGILQQQGKHQGKTACRHALDGNDCQGVPGGNVPGEVIVQSPETTGNHNSQGTRGKPPACPRVQRQQDASQCNQPHRNPRPAADRLLEDQGGNQRGCHAFKVQQ